MSNSILRFLPLVVLLLAFNKEDVVAGPVDFAEVGLTVLQPDGFDRAETFHGFQHPASGSSVMLTAIPGPFSEVTKGLNAKDMASRGMRLKSSEDVDVEGNKGLLMYVAQDAYGQSFLKWMLVFGDDERTRMVTATFPEGYAQNLSGHMKKIVLSTSVSKRASGKPQPSVLFSVTPVEGLVAVESLSGMGKMVAFTKDGKIPLRSPGDPLLVIAPSLGSVPVTDRKAFAVTRLKATADTEEISITTMSEIEVGRLEGLQILATGKDRKTKVAVRIFQVMLFPREGGYVLMTGLVGVDRAEDYMPKFMDTAKTYRSQRR